MLNHWIIDLSMVHFGGYLTFGLDATELSRSRDRLPRVILLRAPRGQWTSEVNQIPWWIK